MALKTSSVVALQRALGAFQERRIGIDGLVSAARTAYRQQPRNGAVLRRTLDDALATGSLTATDHQKVIQSLTSPAAVAAVEEEARGAAGTGSASPGTSDGQAFIASASRPQTAESVADAVKRVTEKRGKSAPQPERGKLINDRFELLNVIGEGGMGRVYRAQDRDQRGEVVALKVLADRFKVHPDSLLQLQKEARQSIRLSHDNIVNVRDCAKDKETGDYYIVMEYLPGQTLDEILKRNAGGAFSFDKAWPIIESVGAALEYAHAKGIVHSDVKPGNVLITAKGETKLLDFGIARALDPQPNTQFEGVQALSALYAAPEQHHQAQPDPRDDVYALACVAYELLAGRHPFETNAVDALRLNKRPPRPGGIGRRQWRALCAGLRFTREKRTRTVKQFLAELSPEAATHPGLRIAVAAAASAALAMLALSYLYPDLSGESLEASYLRELLDESVDIELRVTEVDDLIEEGWAYVEWGRDDFIVGEYQRGNAQLKNGVSTAFWPFYRVLRGTADAEKRRAAAEGIVAIHEAYADAARRLTVQGLHEKALWLACEGLSVPENSDAHYWPALLELFAELWDQVKGRPAGPVDTSCTRIEVPESWGSARHLRSP